jgi:hypothetical protein
VRDSTEAIAFFTEALSFTEEPRHEVFGTVIVFLDRYDKQWDLVQSRAA